MIRGIRIGLVVLLLAAACSDEKGGTPTASNATSAPVADMGFQRDIVLPAPLELVPYSGSFELGPSTKAFDTLPESILVQSCTVKHPNAASDALRTWFADGEISAFAVHRRVAQPLRALIIDARTRKILVRCPLDQATGTAQLIAVRRVVTDEPMATAIYSVHDTKLRLEGSYSPTQADERFRSEDDLSGFADDAWMNGMQPANASIVLHAWSLNGFFSDHLAARLFEDDDWKTLKFNADGNPELNRVIGRPLSEWPRLAWVLVLERGS